MICVISSLKTIFRHECGWDTVGGEVRYTENYTNDDVMNEIVTHGVDALIFIVYFYTLLVVPVRHITKHLFSAYSVGGV